jgi:signal peptidase II
VILALDQWSKRAVALRTADHLIEWTPVVRLRLVASVRRWYERQYARRLLVLLWLAALGSSMILHASGDAFQSRPSLVGLGAALGGAAGNLLDILRSRSVADFIDLGWWPVFNIADVAILGGLAVALLAR